MPQFAFTLVLSGDPDLVRDRARVAGVDDAVDAVEPSGEASLAFVREADDDRSAIRAALLAVDHADGVEVARIESADCDVKVHNAALRLRASGAYVRHEECPEAFERLGIRYPGAARAAEPAFAASVAEAGPDAEAGAGAGTEPAEAGRGWFGRRRRRLENAA